MLRIDLSKERHKFSSAHVTVFEDGSVERLHGHNYAVGVSVEGSSLSNGLLLPFHDLKAVVDELCKRWDEYVLIPTVRPPCSPAFSSHQTGTGVAAHHDLVRGQAAGRARADIGGRQVLLVPGGRGRAPRLRQRLQREPGAIIRQRVRIVCPSFRRADRAPHRSLQAAFKERQWEAFLTQFTVSITETSGQQVHYTTSLRP